MRFVCGVLFATLTLGQSGLCQSSSARKLTERLGEEADSFEKSAHWVIGVETLQQTIPAGFQVSRRGIATKVPERKRVVVSQYSYVPVDEKGGSLREARNVLTVDGLRWNKKRSLEGLAHSLTARDDIQRRKSLEAFESHGLAGTVTDCSQAILLFARGNASKFEFSFEGSEQDEFGAPLEVYRFGQLDGNQAIRIFEGKTVLADKIRGKVWFRLSDQMPVRIGIETVRATQQSKMRDTIVVSYQRSDFGFLLPSRVLHEQYEDGNLNVIDAFEYSEFRQVLPVRAR